MVRCSHRALILDTILFIIALFGIMWYKVSREYKLYDDISQSVELLLLSYNNAYSSVKKPDVINAISNANNLSISSPFPILTMTKNSFATSHQTGELRIIRDNRNTCIIIDTLPIHVGDLKLIHECAVVLTSTKDTIFIRPVRQNVYRAIYFDVTVDKMLVYHQNAAMIHYLDNVLKHTIEPQTLKSIHAHTLPPHYQEILRDTIIGTTIRVHRNWISELHNANIHILQDVYDDNLHMTSYQNTVDTSIIFLRLNSNVCNNLQHQYIASIKTVLTLGNSSEFDQQNGTNCNTFINTLTRLIYVMNTSYMQNLRTCVTLSNVSTLNLVIPTTIIKEGDDAYWDICHFATYRLNSSYVPNLFEVIAFRIVAWCCEIRYIIAMAITYSIYIGSIIIYVALTTCVLYIIIITNKSDCVREFGNFKKVGLRT